MRSIHPVLAVPVIATVDALVVGAYSSIQAFVFGGIFTPLEAAWLTFVYALILALISGSLLAWPFRKWGQFVPTPQVLWFAIIGALAGLIISVTLGWDEGLEFKAFMVAISGFSGFLWWLLVERHRIDWDPQL